MIDSTTLVVLNSTVLAKFDSRPTELDWTWLKDKPLSVQSCLDGPGVVQLIDEGGKNRKLVKSLFLIVAFMKECA